MDFSHSYKLHMTRRDGSASRVNHRGSISGKRRIFFFSSESVLAMGPFHRGEMAEHETNHIPSSVTEFKNTQPRPLTPLAQSDFMHLHSMSFATTELSANFFLKLIKWQWSDNRSWAHDWSAFRLCPCAKIMTPLMTRFLYLNCQC
jgi:hypothetical protein